ncbi:MAG: hypothetical protein GY749_35035 [Desulfobacteraceae bacterium]|nr:hypothetical protein [Desulfobacteraceae bacterium]
MLIERIRLLWQSLRRPIFDKETLIREISEIGHHVTQLSEDTGKEPWVVQRLKALLYQAALQNIWNETVAWGLRIWSDAVNQKTSDKTASSENIRIEENNMSVFDAIRKRQSIRSFDGRSIPGEDIRLLIENAVNAPCSCNRQSWRFIVINEPEEIRYLAEIRHSQWIQKAGAIVLFFCDLNSYRESVERQYTPYLDTGAAIENMLTAATAMGIATCWVNCGPYEIDDNVRSDVYRRFSLDENLLWTGIVVLGYAAKQLPKPPRQSLEHYFVKNNMNSMSEICK